MQVRECGPAAFACNLRVLLPEDRFDRQPLVVGGGKWMIAGDIRIDNRRELEASLSWLPERAKQQSDSDLFAAAWERWQEESLNRVIGDFAIAVWNAEDRSLSLARSPSALKSLFFHWSGRFVAFASTTAGILALDEIPRELNIDHAAKLGGLLSYAGSSTIFEGIRRVEHGNLVRLTPETYRSRRFWHAPKTVLSYPRTSDYVEHFRDELERAVQARLRRAQGKVASQLSAGRDSSAVTTTAAQVLARNDQQLMAITAAPRLGFCGPTVEDRLVDESELARLTAEKHTNVRHFVCRPDGKQVLEQITELHRLSDGPLLNPSNIAWWEEMHQVAAMNGASVLLFGSAGNFTLSAGGPDTLRDILLDDGPIAWLRTALGVGGQSWATWRNIGSLTFGPALPESFYRNILRVSGRSHLHDCAVPTLRSPYRQIAERASKDEFEDLRPPRNYRQYRLAMLQKRDFAEPVTQARWGVDPRDPTADQRLVEFCLSLPNNLLAGRSYERPLFEKAMADRMPGRVLTCRQRGYQTAEWFEHFRPAEMREAFRRFARHTIVNDLFDMAEIDRLIDDWSTADWSDRRVIDVYRNGLIGTLAAADFIAGHFPG